MAGILKQPFVQFLLGGVFLYVALAFTGSDAPDSDDPYVVEVNDTALLTYLQFQDKAFNPSDAERVLAALDADSRDRLVEEFVRDEIMVREAFALGLDQNDDVIRQRLIQKVDFIFQGFADEEAAVENQELVDYYHAHAEQYAALAQATFTHIFFNLKDRDRAEARAAAAALATELNMQKVPFEAAGQYGDRFFFLRNYVERSDRLIMDHFGEEMTGQLFATTPSDTWVGPFSSQYGEHLVMVRSSTPARILTFEEAVGQVGEDLLREKRDAARSKAYEARAAKYQIKHTEAAAK